MAAAATPVHRYRWVILAVGVSAAAAYSALRLGLPALTPQLSERFGLSLAGVGLLLGSIALGQLLTTYAWGRLADSRGERVVLSTGLIGAALALGAGALADDVVVLIALLTLTGMLGASAVTASGRAVMGWFPREERGAALGIRQMALPLGGAGAALALPVITAATSLRFALLWLAGLLLAAGAVALVWAREAPARETGGSLEPAGPPPLRDARLWRLASGTMCLLAAQSAILAFLVLYLHDERGLSVSAAAGGLAAVQLGGALARPLVGRRSDRRGRRLPYLRRIALAAAALLAVSATFAGDAPIALTLGVLLPAGVLAMSWNGLAIAAAMEIAGAERAGAALGIQTTAFAVGSGVMPPLFGLLVQATGWSLAFGALAALQVLGVHRIGPLVDEEEARAGELRDHAAGP